MSYFYENIREFWNLVFFIYRPRNFYIFVWIKYYMARDLGFKIQDSRFKKKSIKMHFRKKYQILKIKDVSTIVLRFYFAQNIVLSNTGAFHKNSLIVACCTFGVLEIRLSTPNRFQIQSIWHIEYTWPQLQQPTGVS